MSSVFLQWVCQCTTSLGLTATDRGQGLGNAITDAAELLKLLEDMKEHTPAELARVVQIYEKEVWPRGYEAVMANLENTIAIHNWETVMGSAAIVAGVKREGDKMAVRAGDSDVAVDGDLE